MRGEDSKCSHLGLQGPSWTWHVREQEDALVEAEGEQVCAQLLKDGHTHTYGKGTVA